MASPARRRLALAAVMLPASRRSAAAQGRLLLPFLPSGPTEIVGTVPASRIQRAMQAAAGSALSDVIGRAVARIAEGHLGHPLAVERVPAGGGRRAVEALLDDPDGGALLLASEALCVHAAVARPGLAALVDRLQPVATCVAVPYRLVQADGGTADCTIASAGHDGRSAALARRLAAMQASAGGTGSCREVTFNGGAAALQALLGGQVSMAVLPEALVAPWTGPGGLRSTPIAAGPGQWPADGWFAVLAPPGWPAPRVEALGEALRAAFAEPLRQDWLQRMGLRALPEPGPLLARRIRSERAGPGG